MKKFYQQDNIFNVILTRIFDLFFVNILWFICCIPVVTIGASTSAMFYVTMKMQEDKESRITSMFFRSFKSNIKQSIPVSLALIFAAAIMLADFHILGRSGDNSHSFIYGVCVTIVILLVMFFSWLFPLMAKFENTIANMFKNAWALAVGNIWRSILLVALNAAPFIWFIVSPETFSTVFWLWFIIGTSLIAFLDSYLINPVMNKLVMREEKGDIDIDYESVYRKWCTDKYFNKETREELSFIDEDEIVDRFYKEIELSAGGMSGIIGAGTNRMNIYTIRKTVQGLSNYINAQERENCSVAIAFDSRSMSSEFAKEAALCLNANGIKTYIFPSLRPAPELSFAIRHLKCIAGIVVTAGHKSSEYNGLKLYWEEGTQITPQHNKNIRTEIEKIENYDEINTVSYEDAVKSGLYKEISEEVDNLYIEQIKSQSIHPELIRKETENISIVYTPLNGAGNVPVRRILKEMGFKNVHVVKEQEEPDGTFPTFVYPNPDDEDAWKLALELAKEKNADLVLATDSDSDRLGVYAKDVKTGEYKKFTGNMSGILIADYIFRERTAKGNMSKKQAMVKSIVTTKMAVPVCKKYNIKLVEVLPGFRYIGERMMQLEQDNTYNYVFGMEENYGCLAGTYAGDKDACEAALMLCEAAAYYKSKDMTLCDAMDSLYKEYGYYKEYTETLTLKGMSGAAKIEALMEEYRSDPPKTIGGYNVLYVRDYQTGLRTSTVDGNKKKMKLSKSNIVFFELENDAWCCVRPLKSEQKIKYYIGVKEDTEKKAEEQLEKVRKCIVGGK